MPQGARIYNLFPLLVGGVSAWEKHLDRIAGMGFNWIFLNPFHLPGFSGSLYAVKDYYVLNPLFAGGVKAAGDSAIRGFLQAARARGLSVMMDLVINHTAKDSVAAQQHPDWFLREADGSLASPFAVDPTDTSKRTVWGDLAEIDYTDRPARRDIVTYFTDVVRHYVRLGFAGFRCDAAYKVPKDVWRALITAARRERDEVIFAAENLGSLLEQTLALRGGGFDYLFNSAKWWDFRQPWLLDQYEQFRSIAPSIAFPESHDTERLNTELRAAGVTDPQALERRYKEAYLFSAVFSTGVMIPIGFEYGFRKKLHVVNTRPADWEKPAFDVTRYIGEVNRMKAALPVLNEEGPQRALSFEGGRVVGLLRRAMRGGDWTLTLINTDRSSPATTRIESLERDVQEGREVTPGVRGRPIRMGSEVTLAAGDVRVYTKA